MSENAEKLRRGPHSSWRDFLICGNSYVDDGNEERGDTGKGAPEGSRSRLTRQASLLSLGRSLGNCEQEGWLDSVRGLSITMKARAQSRRFEPRWPVALTIIVAIILLAVLPGRVRIFPSWFPYVMGIIVLVPMAGVALTAARARWLRIERAVMLLFVLIATAGNIANLTNLISAMIHRPADVSGLQLLSSSIAVWVTNVLMFSLLYWQMDRGGPEARMSKPHTRVDWLFQQESAPAGRAPSDWQPAFADYLYLGFSTATAFSSTDVMPLTTRAKMSMMFEIAISLVTIVVVAARAINILGS